MKSPTKGETIPATVSNRPMKLSVTSRWTCQAKPSASNDESSGKAFARRPLAPLCTSLAKCRAAAAPRLNPNTSTAICLILTLGLLALSLRRLLAINPGVCSTRASTPVLQRPVAWPYRASAPPLTVPIPSTLPLQPQGQEPRPSDPYKAHKAAQYCWCHSHNCHQACCRQRHSHAQRRIGEYPHSAPAS